MSVLDGLLLDIGDVIIGVTPEVFDAFEAATGTRLGGRGPFGDPGDERWQQRLAGAIGGDEYWDGVSREAGFDDWRSLFRAISEVAPDEQFDQDALSLMREARAAGRRVGVLSNDAYAINGPEFFRRRPEFDDLDAFVDSTDVGARKPDPRAFLAAAEALGLAPDQIVFLDDLPASVEGARAVGMTGIHVDPGDRLPTFALARRALGLGSPSSAERLVRRAEAVYQAQDLDAILALFHPDVVIYWNGQKVASGLEEARHFHVEHLGFGEAKRLDFQLSKTLRAADGDTICVEWVSSHRAPDGVEVRGLGGEFWTMRGEQVVEWHAYHHRIG